MALNIKNERVQALAREAAARTGASQTSAVEAALEAYLARLDAADGTRAGAAASRAAHVRALVTAFNADLTDEERAEMLRDLDTLYGEDGLPA